MRNKQIEKLSDKYLRYKDIMNKREKLFTICSLKHYRKQQFIKEKIGKIHNELRLRFLCDLNREVKDF